MKPEAETGARQPQAKDCKDGRQPPGTGRAKDSSSLGASSPKGQACRHPDFRILASTTGRGKSLLFVSLPVCGHLSQQPQKQTHLLIDL